MVFEKNLVFIPLDRTTAERLLKYVRAEECEDVWSNDVIRAIENSLNPKANLCGCCIRREALDDNVKLYVDPFMQTSHTKECIEMEIVWLEQYMTPGSVHRSGLTREERIKQLKKVIE